jgi:hypothetical protein
MLRLLDRLLYCMSPYITKYKVLLIFIAVYVLTI